MSTTIVNTPKIVNSVPKNVASGNVSSNVSAKVSSTMTGIKTGFTTFLGMADSFIVNTILIGITVVIILIILYYIGLYSLLKDKINKLNILLFRNSTEKSKNESS